MVMMIVVGGVVLGDGLIRTKPTAGVQRTGIETLLTFYHILLNLCDCEAWAATPNW